MESLNLDVDTIVPIGLITNELITNALKYAFPDERRGRVSVELKEVEERLLLVVGDNGVGMMDADISNYNSSFGYKLINALVAQLGGDIRIDNTEGTSVYVSLGKYEKVS